MNQHLSETNKQRLQELIGQAHVLLDRTTSISSYCQKAKDSLRKGIVSEEQGKFELAFVYFMRFANILTEIIPKHPTYKHIDLVDSAIYHDLYQKIEGVIAVSELLKQKIIQKPIPVSIAPPKNSIGTEIQSKNEFDNPFLVRPREISGRISNNTQSSVINTTSRARFESSDDDIDKSDSITVQDLAEIISKKPRSVLLFDVRSKALYNKGHILSATIHVEPNVLVNSVLYQSIGSHIEVRFRSLYHSRHKFDYIVYYDEDSVSTLKMKPSLITLKKILEPDFYRIKKRYPLLLKGGYNEFSSKFPSFCNTPDDISLTNLSALNAHISSEDRRKSSGPLIFPAETSTAISSMKPGSSDSLAPSPYNRNLSDYLNRVNISEQLPLSGTRSRVYIPSSFRTYSNVKEPSDFVQSDYSRSSIEKDQNRTPERRMDFSGGVVGLKNLGNTCFTNSILQSLSATIPLQIYFRSGQYRSEINPRNTLSTGGLLAEQFALLVQSLWSTSDSFLVPDQFCNTVYKFSQFNKFEQQDAQELLAFLLDGLHEDLNRVTWKPNDPMQSNELMSEKELASTSWDYYLQHDNSTIVDLFQGLLKSDVQCSSCNKRSTVFNPFMFLSVPLSSPFRKSSSVLNECLNSFTSLEVLDENDRWNCPSCKVYRRASKKLEIWRLPVILIIHLKRFSFEGPKGEKIDTNLIYPLRNLDMSAYMCPSARNLQFPHTYDLYSVVIHQGNLNGGHYTTYCYHPQRKVWFHYDDTKSTVATEHEVQSHNAYILFYIRKDLFGVIPSSLPN